MKITLSELRRLIRETLKENLVEKKDLDKDDDGDKDFADVMMSRMKKGGLSDKEALKKSRKFDEMDEVDEVDEGST